MIVQATKGDRIGGAGLRTSSCELSSIDLTAFRLGLILRLVDALDAECALLHDTTLADCHVRVELVVQGKQ